jgi:lysophospholipase L1-like esterase
MRVHKKIGVLAGLLLSGLLTANVQAAAHESRTLYPSDGTYTTTLTYAAFGDSIVAGYCGWFCRMSSYGVYHAQDVANAFDARVYYDGNAHSGWIMKEIADDIYSHRSEVAAADFIVLEGCGNDYLDARSSYRNQSDCTNETVLATALDRCQTHMVRALNYLSTYKKASAKVYVMSLYYPGMNTDKSKKCGSYTHFDVFADYIVESNWFTCNEAIKRGFKCVDGLAAFNAPDTDTDGNGVPESAEIRFNPATDYNDLNGYYTRVLIDNKSVLSDANYKRLANGSTADYLQSDDTHPTAAGHKRLGTEHTALGF